MPKPLNSVIGIDLGQYALKAVYLQRKSAQRLALTHYGYHVPAEPAKTAEQLAQQLKALIRDMGSKTAPCVVAFSSPEGLVRILEQPDTPPEMLRDALRLNGMALLNQDVKNYVVDCDYVDEVPPGGGPRKYLVGAVPRLEVERLGAAMDSAKLKVRTFQMGSVCIFNAFEFAYPQIFASEAFFLLDVGHNSSTMLIGLRRNLLLVRTVEFGGRALVQALTGLAGSGRESVFEALEQEDEVMVEYTRVALSALAREVSSSIGFFEAQHDQTIPRVFVSGGPAKSRTFIKLLSEELSLPCTGWAAAEGCDNALAAGRREQFLREGGELNAACGAAAAELAQR